MKYKMNEYELIKDETIKLLDNNPEWIERYNNYQKDLEMIKKVKTSEFLHIPDCFTLCTSISRYINYKNKNTIQFDLRYEGNTLFNIIIDTNSKEIYMKPAKSVYAKKELSSFNFTNNLIKWNDLEARKIRKFYISKEKTKEKEHGIEIQLKKLFNKKKSNDKPLYGIQTINLFDKPFQMPTPLSASNVKDNNKLKYSKDRGGGIDILARVGKGKATNLAIFELKDEQSKTEEIKEAPEIAIKQAICYATFIRELLRNKKVDNNFWWHFFGFKSEIPKKLKILTVICLPKRDTLIKDFVGYKIKFDGEFNKDHLELNYYYYDINNLKEAADTSLVCIK